MSTGVDSTSRRPTLWSYVSGSYSSPRRRSVTLPARNNGDPFEKADRHSSGQGGNRRVLDEYKAAWMAQTPRTRAVRTGAIIAFIIFLFFLLAPGERHKVENAATDFVQKHGTSTSPQSPLPNGEKCIKPYGNKPLKQYALMIDAGSTGSRIHVYRFNNCGASPELENEVFKMTEKIEGRSSGLSAYKDDPEAAAKSLDILMQTAMESVPDEYKSCSPIALKATAGLRLAGEEKSAKVLAAVRKHLEDDYPFPVISEEKKGVVIMDGSEEGVYAWITTNYLLGKIGGPDKTPTAAIFDLGGGSTQIVFEPTFKGENGGMPEKLAEGDHKYALKFGGRAFDLYQHSHLGYGLMEARKHIHKTIAEAHKKANPESTDWAAKPIENPCLIPNTTETVEVELNGAGKVEVKMVGPAVGAPAQCRGIAEKTLKKEAECKLAPCSFNGIHQPSLAKTFAAEDVFIFSYFFDRLAPLGMPESFTLREMQDLTARVCEGKDSWGSFEGIEGAIEELDGRPQHCLDMNFMMALLHTGYEMPLNREVKIAKKIKGNELGWCLGASLPLLEKESGWQCKIKKVQ